MHRRRLIAGAVTLSVALGTAGVAVAAKTGAAPAKTTIKVSQKIKMKPNRYIQDGLRWNKDVYKVRSGGTLHIVNTVATEGPHTFSVVKKSQLPRTAASKTPLMFIFFISDFFKPYFEPRIIQCRR